jgi:hypothetical protein
MMQSPTMIMAARRKTRRVRSAATSISANFPIRKYVVAEMAIARIDIHHSMALPLRASFLGCKLIDENF